MRLRLALAIAGVALWTDAVSAQCVPGYVAIGCPPPPPPSIQYSVPRAPQRTGEDIDDELSDWCEQVTKPPSIVICADRDLRQMAMIRNKLFADARAILPPDAYKDLLQEQSKWVQTYSSSCGISPDGPEPSQPISPVVISCFNREGEKRIAAVISRLGQQKPGYHPASLTSAQAAIIDAIDRAQREAQRQQAEREEAERRRQAALEEERARAQLRAQAMADRQAALSRKLEDGGFKTMSPIDFELDWRDLRAKAQKVALKGTYMDVDDVEGLMVSNKDQPVIRLYTDGASRDARKAMLECRNSNYVASLCEMVIGASVISCVRNKDQMNEKELPCLRVEEAFINPAAAQ